MDHRRSKLCLPNKLKYIFVYIYLQIYWYRPSTCPPFRSTHSNVFRCMSRAVRVISAGSLRKMLELLKMFWRKFAMLSGGIENTLSWRYPKRKKSQAVKSGDRGGHSVLWANPITWFFTNAASSRRFLTSMSPYWSLTSKSQWADAPPCIYERPLNISFQYRFLKCNAVLEEQTLLVFVEHSKTSNLCYVFFRKARTNNQFIPTECSPDGGFSVQAFL